MTQKIKIKNARTTHTVELHSKSPAAYYPIPLYEYKISSFAAYIANRLTSCASCHFQRTSLNPGHVPMMSFLIGWAHEGSSRPRVQLTLQHITFPRNSLQALRPRHLHRHLLLHLRFPPLLAVHGHLDVFVHHRVPSRIVLGAESAGRERLDSKLACELHLRRSRVPMEGRRWRCVGGVAASELKMKNFHFHYRHRYGSLEATKRQVIPTICNFAREMTRADKTRSIMFTQRNSVSGSSRKRACP